MPPARTVRVTRNFARNLDGVRGHLEGLELPRAFDDLLSRLFDSVAPRLKRFPEIGTDFLARAPGSVEGLARLDALRKRLPAGVSVRQYVFGDYLLLYAVGHNEVYLLSIKHHRQLSFDLTEP